MIGVIGAITRLLRPLLDPPDWPRALAVLALIAVTGFFRFANLGYSELQGDEARAVLMAHELRRSGDAEVLLLHKKGPLEILLPAALMFRGDLGETTARLPFAVAGFLGVLAVLVLGARWWGARAGWVAAMLLALDGYLIAFARIVQYQSVVFLCSVLAVGCAWRFYRRAADGDRALALAGLLVGLGTWAHYEMVFALPPVAWLALARAREEGWGARAALRRFAPAALLLAGVAALFYLPFVRHPHFAATSAYILDRRVGNPPYNMLADFFDRASFYNASYYVVAMAAALAAVVAARLRGAWGRGGTILAAAWLGALGVLAARPEWFAIGPAGADPPRSLAVLVFAPVGIALLADARADAPWRAALLWLAGPFLAAGFLVQKPHTHFYTMLPAWALVVGWGADRGLAFVKDRGGRAAAWAIALVAGAGLFAVLAVHQYVVFIRHTPEYKRVYPEARLPGYWVPFGDEPPRGGYFGFPYRAGWNTVRALFEVGGLSGDYDSNEEPLITGWYTGGAPRCPGRPRYYIVAWRPQDAEDIPLSDVERDYHLHLVIRVGGMDKLWVYDREPVPGGPITLDDDPAAIYDWLTFVPGFEGPGPGGGPSRPGRSVPVAQSLALPLPEVARDARFGDAIQLAGADFPLLSEAAGALAWEAPADDAGRGGDAIGDLESVGGGPGNTAPVPVLRRPFADNVLGVTLVWEALGAVDRDYSVFVHLVDAGGRTVAQSDGWPDCGRSATSAWRTGEVRYDPRTLPLPGDLPEGRYTVRAGLYDPADGERLAVQEGLGAPRDAVDLWAFDLADEAGGAP